MIDTRDDDRNRDVKIFGIAAAVSVAVYALLPFVVVRVFALLGIAVFSWRFLFEAATIVSSRLSGSAHNAYQIAVSGLFPVILSLYFVFSSDALDARTFLTNGWSFYDLIPVAILGYIGWASGSALNAAHPFRGYWIGATILFVLNFMWHGGMASFEDEYGDGSSFYMDKDEAQFAKSSGHYFFHYLYQVLIVYLPMLSRQIYEDYQRQKYQVRR